MSQRKLARRFCVVVLLQMYPLTRFLRIVWYSKGAPRSKCILCVGLDAEIELLSRGGGVMVCDESSFVTMLPSRLRVSQIKVDLMVNFV